MSRADTPGERPYPHRTMEQLHTHVSRISALEVLKQCAI